MGAESLPRRSQPASELPLESAACLEGGGAMKCVGCQRTLEVGDHYIEDTSTGFMDREPDKTDLVVNDLLADIFGGHDGKVVFCEDCTQAGGDYLFETVYGDEE